VAGIEVERFEIDKDGKIVVIAEKAPRLPCGSDYECNEWDGPNDTPSATVHKRVS
jgi:hypothetical protein